MDASTTSLLGLPAFQATSPLQSFAIFVNFFFPALALIVVIVRVAGRVAARQLAADDWLVCVAMLMSVAETIISYFFIKTNFIGIPVNQVPLHDPTEGLIWTYAVQILYNPILALVKSSVLIFLTRIFGQKTWVRRSLLLLNVANISQMVAVFFAILLQCTPIPFNWDPSIRGGYCVDRRILYLSTAVFNIMTDVLILGLPLFVFATLRIPKRTKIALLVVFLLGFLVTITSVIRLVVFVQGLFGIPIFPNSASNNVGFVTSAIEINLAIITASAPALRPIFRSRDRGGWFARSVMMTTTTMTRGGGPDSSDPDLEKSQQPLGWDRSSSFSAPTGRSKLGRGGNRGGRKTSNSSRRGRGGSTKGGRPTIVRIRTDRDAAELRSASPRPSEEQTMTANGIVRVSDIQREIDGLVKDIAVAGKGSYTGSSGNLRSITTPPTTTTTTNNNNNTNTANTASAMRPITPKTPSAAAIARPRPSMETITVGVTVMTPRPSTSGSATGRRWPAPPLPSAAALPSAIQTNGGEGWGDGDNEDDDRVSKYLDRRFGVVTPRGTTPTAKGWEGSGRPF